MRLLVRVLVLVGAAISPACGPPPGLPSDTAGPPASLLVYSGLVTYSSVTALGVLPGGDLLIAGTFIGMVDVDPGAGVDLRASTSTGDGATAFFGRVRATGDAVWTRLLAGTGSASIRGVAVDASGAVIVNGAFTGTIDFDPGDAEDLRAAGDTHQGFVSKLSPTGEHLWTWALGDMSSRLDVTIAPGGAMVVTGMFYAPIDFDPGPAADVRTPMDCDAFAVEIDGNARLVRPAWTFGGSACDSVTRAHIASDGTLYLGGMYTNGTDLNPGPGVLQPAPVSIDRTQGGYVLSLDRDRKLRWAQIYPDSVDVVDLALGPEGIFVGGTFFLTADLVSRTRRRSADALRRRRGHFSQPARLRGQPSMDAELGNRPHLRQSREAGRAGRRLARGGDRVLRHPRHR